MKKLLISLISLFVSVICMAQSITITDASGWLECAYVKWQADSTIDSYNVYYSGEGVVNKKIDTQLIRSYGTYYRADILGLKPGKYSVEVVPVIAGKEGVGTKTDSLQVQAYDRTGYAFWNNRVPGAYKADGTPKDNAVIIYITQNDKNTISMNVTGANANPCVGLQAILDGFKKGKDTRPLIVRLIGQITDLDYMLSGDVVIEDNNNPLSYITFEGVGDDAVADGWGLRIKNATNIEVRNLGYMNCNSDEGDDVGLQQNNDHIWVHNCDMFYGDAGSDADQIKGDGALDCKKSTYVTVSYNHFWDNGKCNLLGLSEDTTTGLFITYHHNWYDHSDSRHPRVRFYSAHVYNNYYDGNAKYGIGATMGSSVFVEANYFRDCKYPMLISMQGSDVWDGSTQSNDYVNMPTFSKEDGGIIKAYNNYMIGEHRFVPYGAAGYTNSTVDFDAYVATSRNEKVGSNVKSVYGANTYNNFDTDSTLIYKYTPDSPEVAKEKVMEYAGRTDGGDFHWTFDNAVDDASYAVNQGLKDALVNYKTALVSVQGDSVNTGGNNGGGNDTIPSDTTSTGRLIQNFTLSGTSSTFFNIIGNLSTTKGTVTYNGLTLTQCLKIESTTQISFTSLAPAELTLVFNSDFSGRIKINGNSYTASGGILTLNLAAGNYQITKQDVANLYYMSLAFQADGLHNSEIHTTKLYPIPVSNQLNISTDLKIKKIEVYSLSGVVVKCETKVGKSIDLSQINPGNYVVKIYSDQGVEKYAVIKK